MVPMVQTDKVREKFAQRLALACKEAKLELHGRGTAIARALNISSKAASKWLNAESLPRPAILQDLAKFLRVDAVWLQLGIKPSEGGDSTYLREIRRKNTHPLISWIIAGQWEESVDPYSIDGIKDWFESDAHVMGKAFWLKVEGDSMTSMVGTSIPNGSLVLIDTGRKAVNGNLVIAKLFNANEATFKKLITDAGQKFLKPLNPSFPLIPIDENCKFIGVAIEAKQKLV